MANPKDKGKTMKEQADDILGLVEVGTEEELKQVHAGGQKDSKWRRVVEAFLESGEKIWKIPAPEDGEYKVNAIKSGLDNALDGFADRGDEKPVKVTSSKAKALVLMYNTELVSEEEQEAVEAA